MRKSLIYQWRKFWTRFAGARGFGRIAGSLAAWRTVPYRRSGLAQFHARGFTAPTAVLAHPKLRTGKHVWIGDRVWAHAAGDSGEIDLDDRVHLYGDLFLLTGEKGTIRIGADTHIQPACHIHAYVCGIQIGRNVEIAARCAFYSYDHGTALGEVIMNQPLQSKGPICVGDGAWLGHGVIVLSGVQIGAGAVIAAGSVVACNIPDNAIAGGIPARVLKYRS